MADSDEQVLASTFGVADEWRRRATGKAVKLVRLPVHSHIPRSAEEYCSYTASHLVRLEGFSWALPSDVLPTSIAIANGGTSPETNLIPAWGDGWMVPLPDLHRLQVSNALRPGQSVSWFFRSLQPWRNGVITLWGTEVQP